MRYRLIILGAILAGCSSEPRSRLPTPNPDGTITDVPPDGVADLAGYTPPPVTENPPPTITAITPKLAPSSGGVKLTITGAGFDKNSQVFVNNAFLFVDPSLVKPTEISVTLPPLPGGFGPVPVVVKNKDGRVGRNDPDKTPFSLYSSTLSFSAASAYSNPAGQYGDATLADLNEDGKLDLVVANARTDYSHQNSLTIFMNDGLGGFDSADIRNMNCQPVQHVRAADVNKDGHLDLVFPCNDHGYYVGVMLNRKSGDRWGNFGSPQYTRELQSFGNGCYRTTSVDVADFDNDGTPDLAIGCYHQSVQIWKGNGGGSFSFRSSWYFDSEPHYYFDLKAADFDGDGNQDIAALSAFHQVLQVARGNGDGTRADYQTYGMYGQPWHVEVADLNQDKKPDLIVSHRYDERIVVLQNSNGDFSNRQDYNLAHQHGQIRTMDMNGDGLLDVIVAAREGYEAQGTILLGKGDGTLTGRTNFRTGGSSPWGLAVGQFDADAKPDVMLILIDNAQVQLLSNTSQ